MARQRETPRIVFEYLDSLLVCPCLGFASLCGRQTAPRNLSRNGILFASPEPLEVGEAVEIRLTGPEAAASPDPLRLRGRVVRLEELPPERSGAGGPEPERYDVGVAFDLDRRAGHDALMAFLEQAQVRAGSAP